MAAALDYTYRYPHSSAVGELPGGFGLQLATCDRHQEHPHFFDGKVRYSRELGQLLLVLSEVVRTHFFKPIPALLDPFVTSGPGMLRFAGSRGL